MPDDASYGTGRLNAEYEDGLFRLLTDIAAKGKESWLLKRIGS